MDAAALLLLEAAGPEPYGPGQWGLQQWLGFALYAALFLLFVYLVYRLARPTIESERGAEED